MKKPTKIIFAVTEDWFFCSHFLRRAVAAHQQGYQVTVVTRVQNHGNKITSCGLKLIPINLLRRTMNPWHELLIIWELVRIYKSERPDIVHHVALKPILYGSIAALITRVPFIINAPVGMGFVFSSQKWQAKLFRPLVILAYYLLLDPANSRVIFENPDDLKILTNSGLVNPERATLIRGAGVDPNVFAPRTEPEGTPVVILAARMLWDKGVGEFVEAVSCTREEGVSARFVLVGNSDPGNPTAVPAAQLDEWRRSGVVEWWEHREDMPEVISKSNIVVLPSYREGLPKVLIEAASCGRAIVATDVPGCREIVRHNENGLLVPPRDSKSLANALKILIKSPELRAKMGARGRELVEAEFTEEIVVKQTLEVYERLISQIRDR